MSYKIEKNVAMPVSATGGRTPTGLKYPLRELDVGDSFVINDEPELSLSAALQRIKNALKHYGGTFPERSHRAALEDKNGKQVIRVWRVK